MGTCDAAFTFYETVFKAKREVTMRWGEGPAGSCPAGAEALVMHTALSVGGVMLMGADAPPGQGKPFSGIDISVDDADESEVRRMFAALSEGGRVNMELQPTFWTSLFGMCTDKFGVSWMLSIPGPPAA